MASTPASNDWVEQRAAQIRETVLAQPGVASLAAGTPPRITTYLPGTRLPGVRVLEPGAPVEVGFVATLEYPLPEVCAAIRERVRAIAGDIRVDVTVVDALIPAEAL